MYELLSRFKPKFSEVRVGSNNQLSLVQNPNGGRINLQWNSSSIGSGIQISGSSVFLKENAYVFRTAVCNQGFYGG